MHRSLEFRSVSVRVMCVAKQSVTKIYSLKQKQKKKKKKKTTYFIKKCHYDFFLSSLIKCDILYGFNQGYTKIDYVIKTYVKLVFKCTVKFIFIYQIYI